jgi:hypothetical protein
MKNPALFSESNRATYCPEDDKLRLYVGRVPKEEYLALKAEGWTSTAKQDCDFVAVWTVSRKNTAESYAGIIEDEDAGPEDRAADRAERFSGYLDKRLGEATGHADRYAAGPSAHGYQSKARAVRSADRHDRMATRAVDAWDKAEYWQHRTAGVISNALHKSSPGVRMGRIKTIEAEKRKAEKSEAEYAERFRRWSAVATEADPATAHRMAYTLANTAGSDWSNFHHPREASRTAYDAAHGTSIYSLMTQAADPITGHEAAAVWLAGRVSPDSPEYFADRTQQFIRHCALRLAYEMQMLEAQGGRAALVEMEVGGFIGGYQIRKVNKSTATGRVVSVTVMAKGDRWGNTSEGQHLTAINIERLAESSYRAPTAEDKQSLKELIKAEKAADTTPKAAPLVNPTREDAERLQALWNERAEAKYPNRCQPQAVVEMTQAQYSTRSGGSYGSCETRHIDAGGDISPSRYYVTETANAVCKLRSTHGAGGFTANACRVILITDKPQKPFPAAIWPAVEIAKPATAKPSGDAGERPAEVSPVPCAFADF